MNLCTNKKIMFEHLMKEDEIYLIPDVFFSKLNTNNQRSLWNSEYIIPEGVKMSQSLRMYVYKEGGIYLRRKY